MTSVLRCVHHQQRIRPPTPQTPPDDVLEDGLWRRVFADVTNCSDDRLLRFRALSTDGGVDALRTAYWVDHMFAYHKHSAFCSEVGKNFHCLAVLVVRVAR